ncbi:MAG: Hsp70 family protein [Flavobacterium sp.]
MQSNTINFGIDLGTTNSLITKFQNGAVEIFKNPISLKETLPSVVAFRKGRIIVGDKAKEFIEKDPENVISSFKRKMGTSQQYFIPNIEETRSAIELSAMVLKELKNFVYTGESIDSVAITIPASFDTIQSNATKKAGYEAGFSEVVLLQEPIAASLAFANKNEGVFDLIGQWLVYDLGGGTFDVTLIRIEDEEMKVVDHEGDNFLGGVDFDALIVEKIISTHLESIGRFDNLIDDLKSAKGKYNKLYYILLHKAEEIKIALSNQLSAEIEFEITDDEDTEHEVFLTIHREQFESIIREKISYSLEMLTAIIERNQLSINDINQVILVGGSTYIPLVRNMIQEVLGISVNASVDPTTAVAVGAAYYAGTKTKTITSQTAPNSNEKKHFSTELSVKMAYQKTSRDSEEFFAAAISGNYEGLFYRITRSDGGFDTGLKALKDRVSEMLRLIPNANNSFQFKVFDSQNNPISLDIPTIEILQGKFSVFGQPLPNDICIEVDDFENNTTKLELIFQKNSILPLKKTIVREITKTIPRNSDNKVIINILEGSRFAMPSSNLPIGVIELSGKTIETDLIKGSDIEITLEMTESRDLKITAVLLINDQEISELFNPSERKIYLARLTDEIDDLLRFARQELRRSEYKEEYESAGKLASMVEELERMQARVRTLKADDVTDEKYQIEERKRRIAATLDSSEQSSRLAGIKESYFAEKSTCEALLAEKGTEKLRLRFENIIAKEKEFMSAQSAFIVRGKTEELRSLSWEIQKQDPMMWVSLFHHYSSLPLELYKDTKKMKKYIEVGEKALERQNYEELKIAVYGLYDLLPDDEKGKQDFSATGIG